MFIKQIELNNYRVYKGKQNISFEREADRNIYIISGNNGFGKTSFLTSLIWCLYGKNMQDVDDSYKARIFEAGGYKKYLRSCINVNALAKQVANFTVSILLSDIVIPGYTYNEIIIERSYNVSTEEELLKVLLDGQDNQLIHEIGQEIFINDFILPKEIARFFFFDAERNVSLAEMHSLTDRKNVSRAYSEILGIKKYEELKQNLTDLRLRFRKESAGTTDTVKLKAIEDELTQLEKLRLQGEENLRELIVTKETVKQKIDSLQEKLIREGSTISPEGISKLTTIKNQLAKEYDTLKLRFTELMELAPFAIAGNLMAEVEKQLRDEAQVQNEKLSPNVALAKIKAIQDSFHEVAADQLQIDQPVKSFFEETLKTILHQHLFEQEADTSSKMLHNFDTTETMQFRSVMDSLRSSYRNNLTEVNKAVKRNRYEFSKVVKELSNAESKETDQLIQNYRTEKDKAEGELIKTEEAIIEVNKSIAVYEHQYANKKRIYEELNRKVTLSDKYKDKDALAERLVNDLNTFLVKIKNEKRAVLEKRILQAMNALMHKSPFVTDVSVTISNDIVDIRLYNYKTEILKENLSKGEQQLYATALLKALVEESGIRFPVFVDSPLQKFDRLHSSKVITEFYPGISEQVVLFPLLHKELTEEEYALLKPYTKATYLIENKAGEGSTFTSCHPDELLQNEKPVFDYAY